MKRSLVAIVGASLAGVALGSIALSQPAGKAGSPDGGMLKLVDGQSITLWVNEPTHALLPCEVVRASISVGAPDVGPVVKGHPREVVLTARGKGRTTQTFWCSDGKTLSIPINQKNRGNP